MKIGALLISIGVLLMACDNGVSKQKSRENGTQQEDSKNVAVYDREDGLRRFLKDHDYADMYDFVLVVANNQQCNCGGITLDSLHQFTHRSYPDQKVIWVLGGEDSTFNSNMQVDESHVILDRIDQQSYGFPPSNPHIFVFSSNILVDYYSTKYIRD